MQQASLSHRLVHALPFYYGWVVLGAVGLACFARAGPAVATFSLFVTPMSADLGWSRTTLAGAVSLGGVLAALLSPMIGSYLDRRGARVVLGLAVLATGTTLALLCGIESVLGFYLLYCIARMCWAGPFDLGIHGAVNTWFVARRGVAASVVTLAHMAGLTMMPLIGYWVTAQHGWRAGWLAVGLVVLGVGFLPAWLLLIRRPEDVGLAPDGAAPSAPPPSPASSAGAPVAAGAAMSGPAPSGAAATATGVSIAATVEPQFTRAEALRTRTFWMLALYTALIYPVQAGLSLHQAAHLIERGFAPASAATVVSAFSLASALTGFSYGLLRNRIDVRAALAFAGVLLAVSASFTLSASTFAEALAGGILFGLGMGGMQTLLPIAWADYFGRRNYGAIRGIALTVQVTAQATGPLASGLLRDWSGDYTASLMLFATLSALGALTALAVRAPLR